MRTSHLGIAAAILALLAGGGASAEQFDYLRMTQPSSLDRNAFTAAYNVEVSRGMLTMDKGTGGGGTGGGGGLGGRSDYQGVNHRLYAWYAPLKWLAIGVEQSVKQPDVDTFTYGVLYPEVRFRLPWLREHHLTPSVFTGSRIRVNARRPSTMVTGVGLERRHGRFGVLGEVAFETSLAEDNRENGLRYEAGGIVQLVGPVVVGLEAWGSVVWQEGAQLQHDFHIGPTLKVRLHRFWVGANVGAGIKERPNKTFYDYGCIGQVGFAL